MAAKAPGTIILYWTDPNDARKTDLYSINARVLVKTGALDTQPIIDYWHMKQVWKQGDKLNVAFIHTGTTADLNSIGSDVSVPVTIKNLHAGIREEAEIECVGKYKFTEDVTTGTKDARLRILYYVCPAGIEFVLGKKRAFNSRLMADIYTT